jgi:signal transduction histidine kinase
MAGDLSRRLPRGRRRDEFDGLAVELNAMLERIETLMEDVRQVTNDIAHDLRTPLARLRHGLEDARRKAGSVQDYERAVDAAVEETDRILETFTALLRIAQIEAGTRRAGFAEVDLSGLLSGLAETYAVVAEDRGQALTSTIEPGVRAVGDRDLLGQMVANLIENALTHTPPRSRIAVTLAAGADGPVATVADDGPGIPADMRQQVLKPFVRLEGSRTAPGNGLGLASVAAIARLHGIALGLSDNGPGLRATLPFVPSGAAGERGAPAAALSRADVASSLPPTPLAAPPVRRNALVGKP